MRKFHSFAAFADHLVQQAAQEVVALHEGLEIVVRRIERDAKDEIGHYQAAAGSFPAWEELADSTELEKERLDYPLDAPLERTLALQESIGREVGSLEGVVASDSDVMVYQELGTERIPPRPVLGPAALRNEDLIKRVIGAAAITGVLGGAAPMLLGGYDFKTEDNR
ncbi:hypothetical protein EO087_00250 [Dyella sp. M7H15-1]|uniref:hypothetical protein n=1 Tax=Dyella sp. M7H15-1 TaxID=2501295 RepID=UPI001004D781|nr:hypothetical protein [Dyella sp. M7H15-1]QAU22596.1 hypothetical protein EO087_00250 [Dyella sp. M7H15-1]